MKKFENIQLRSEQKNALRKIKHKIYEAFPVQSIILFGSMTTGDFDSESDIDLFILTEKILTRSERHRITDIVFEVNLEFNTNFSTLVVDRKNWECGVFSVLPVKDEIVNNGIEV